MSKSISVAMERSYYTDIANILSALTILSCVFMKVPQIMSVRRKKSGEGMFIHAIVMEICGYTIMTLYNITQRYYIMTYLEYPIILLQVYVLMYYVLKFDRLLDEPIVPFAVAVYVFLIICFALEFFSKDILAFMVPMCTPMSGFAKVMYIYGIFQASNADAVSLTTWIISVATNISRVFTVFMDSSDLKLMVNFTISAALSLSVLATAIYYQKIYVPPSPPPRPRRKPSYRRHSHGD